MAVTILVVDDQPDMVNTYERLLRRQRYRIIPATTCRRALECIYAERLALVVTDLGLPDGDGLEVVRAARAVSAPPPVVIVTGYGTAASRRQAAEAGASAYVVKPFSIGPFVELVDTLLASSSPDARTDPRPPGLGI